MAPRGSPKAMRVKGTPVFFSLDEYCGERSHALVILTERKDLKYAPKHRFFLLSVVRMTKRCIVIDEYCGERSHALVILTERKDLKH